MSLGESWRLGRQVRAFDAEVVPVAHAVTATVVSTSIELGARILGRPDTDRPLVARFSVDEPVELLPCERQLVQ
jgi:hypothetical protein